MVKDKTAKDCKIGSADPNRETNKIKCYQYDKLGHRARHGRQFKDRTKAITTSVHGNDTDEYDEVLMISERYPLSEF